MRYTPAIRLFKQMSVRVPARQYAAAALANALSVWR